jgi:hypothetical protein
LHFPAIDVHVPRAINVGGAADAERIRSLVQQASDRALRAGITAGVELGVREGVRLSIPDDERIEVLVDFDQPRDQA